MSKWKVKRLKCNIKAHTHKLKNGLVTVYEKCSNEWLFFDINQTSTPFNEEITLV